MNTVLKGRSTTQLLGGMLCLQLGLVPLAMAAQVNTPQQNDRSGAIALEAVALEAIPAPVLQELKSARSPIQVELLTGLQGETIPVGTAFEAMVKEPYRYQQSVLPAGTHLRGVVSQAQNSKRFNRPGYVSLEVTEAVLPTGEIISLREDATETGKTKKVYSAHTKTFKSNLKRQAPIMAVGMGVAAIAAWPVALGARAAIGVGQELLSKDEEAQKRSAVGKVGRGLFRATGIPMAVDFVKKAPEARFVPGDKIALYLDDAGLKKIFVTPAETALQPKAPTQASTQASTEAVTEVTAPPAQQPQTGTNAGENTPVSTIIGPVLSTPASEYSTQAGETSLSPQTSEVSALQNATTLQPTALPATVQE